MSEESCEEKLHCGMLGRMWPGWKIVLALALVLLVPAQNQVSATDWLAQEQAGIPGSDSSGWTGSLPEAQVEARLVSSPGPFYPGERFWVGLEMAIAKGWHTYFRNPGDAGGAPGLQWRLPEGFSASELEFPAPMRIPYGQLMSFGYRDRVIFPVAILTDEQVRPGLVVLEAQAQWLVCSDICIPQAQDLKLVLELVEAGTFRDSTAGGDLVRRYPIGSQVIRAVGNLPQPWPGEVCAITTSSRLQIALSTLMLEGAILRRVEYFPFSDQVIEHAARQEYLHSGDQLWLEMIPSSVTGTSDEPPQFDGIVVLQLGSGSQVSTQAYEIRPDGPCSPALVERLSAAQLTGQPKASVPAVALTIGLALLGGLLLNLMPCVLPVLSLKLISLGDELHPLRQAWGMTAGMVSSFVVFGGLLHALITGGQWLGWGFQLQSPPVVVILVYLFGLIGMNLSGVFSFGHSLTKLGRVGQLKAFGTGVLSFVVATPCLAPFMGSALGLAVLQPLPVALTIFAALGVGMALPYLLMGCNPSLLALLPRPGRWMEVLRQALAFPMYATAGWLIWVLSNQAGPAGVAVAIGGLLVIAVSGWVFEQTRYAGARWRYPTAAGVLGAGMVIIALVGQAGGLQESSPKWEEYSQAHLDDLRAQGRPIFINFTAAWCLTCLVNEALVLESSAIWQAVEAGQVAMLKADWTNPNPEIARALREFGQIGVPLYVFYPADAEAIVLGQTLDEGQLLATMGGASG